MVLGKQSGILELTYGGPIGHLSTRLSRWGGTVNHRSRLSDLGVSAPSHRVLRQHAPGAVGNYFARTLGATTTFEHDHHIFLAWRKDMTNREGNRQPEIAVIDEIFDPVRLNLIQWFLLSRSLSAFSRERLGTLPWPI